MKQVKGLGGWIRSAIWLELIIPGYFFGKTFGTADAKFRFLDTFMYPPLFINICGYFRDLPVGYYTGRFLGVLAGAIIGVLCALLIGVFYKWVLKDWAYSKAARLGSLAFILVALLTGFMSDMFNESIGMGLRIEENTPDELVGKFLVQDYGSFTKGHPHHRAKRRAACRATERCGPTMRQAPRAGGSPPSYLFMYGLRCICSAPSDSLNETSFPARPISSCR